MKNLKIFLLNGPPRCGKDTIANILKAELHDQYIINTEDAPLINAEVIKFADPLRHSMQAFLSPLMLGHARPMQNDLWSLKLEEIKSRFIIDDKTVRDCMISLSEDWAKEFFHPGIFGEITACKIDALMQKDKFNVFFISDSGFASEARELTSTLGDDAVELIKVFRNGCDFTNDSRDYINILDIKDFDDTVYEIHNNKDTLCLRATAINVIRNILYDTYTSEKNRANTSSEQEQQT